MKNNNTEREFILISDPEILKIATCENNEEFVDLVDQTTIAFGPSPEIPNNSDYTKIRKKVYEMLVRAQNILPSGIKLCIYEGHRSLELQEKLYSHRYNKVKIINTSWDHKQIFLEATKLVAPLINLDGSKNIPPHSTGGAVDVYLIDENGKKLDMGIETDNWINDIDGKLSKTDSNVISELAINNRKIMSYVLKKVGFINYPTEYWHWSYGDRYWAYHKRKNYAIYGPK